MSYVVMTAVTTMDVDVSSRCRRRRILESKAFFNTCSSNVSWLIIVIS
jgi:hypothetical protein